MNFELTKEFLQELSLAVAKRNGNYVSEKIQDLHADDIAEVFDRIDLLEAQFIYELLDEEVASDVLVELEEDIRDKFLKSFTAQEIASQVDNMDSDDATDLIQDLSEERKEKVVREETQEKGVVLPEAMERPRLSQRLFIRERHTARIQKISIARERARKLKIRLEKFPQL